MSGACVVTDISGSGYPNSQVAQVPGKFFNVPYGCFGTATVSHTWAHDGETYNVPARSECMDTTGGSLGCDYKVSVYRNNDFSTAHYTGAVRVWWLDAWSAYNGAKAFGRRTLPMGGSGQWEVGDVVVFHFTMGPSPPPSPPPPSPPQGQGSPRFLPKHSCDATTAALAWRSYASRVLAAAACVTEGCTGLGTQAEQVAMGPRCVRTWNSESSGYYMEEVLDGCGNAVGWNSFGGPAAAFCVGCPACSSPSPPPSPPPPSPPAAADMQTIFGVDFTRGGSGSTLQDGLAGLMDAYGSDGDGNVDTTAVLSDMISARGYTSNKKKKFQAVQLLCESLSGVRRKRKCKGPNNNCGPGQRKKCSLKPADLGIQDALSDSRLRNKARCRPCPTQPHCALHVSRSCANLSRPHHPSLSIPLSIHLYASIP